MFPDITVVITSPIIGKIQNVVTLEKLFAQFCPDNMRDKLIKPPMKIEIKHLKINPSNLEEIKLINLSSMDYLIKDKIIKLIYQ